MCSGTHHHDQGHDALAGEHGPYAQLYPSVAQHGAQVERFAAHRDGLRCGIGDVTRIGPDERPGHQRGNEQQPGRRHPRSGQVGQSTRLRQFLRVPTQQGPAQGTGGGAPDDDSNGATAAARLVDLSGAT